MPAPSAPLVAPFFDPIDDEPQLRLNSEVFPDRRALLFQLSDAIAKCTPPQVFGIHGDWGTGKTSFLHQLQYRLTGECPQNRGCAKFETDEPLQGADNVTAIWFEAWRYQHESAPIIALLHELRAQLMKKRFFLQRMVDDLGNEMEVTVNAALLALEDLTAKLSLKLGPLRMQVGGKGPRLREAQQQWEGDNLAAKLPSHHIREHLEKILGDLLPKEVTTSKAGGRLVIFIDDLDRCEPEAAFRLLESIKIYLNLKNCVFVLGLNQREIERAIASVLPKDQPGKEGEDAVRSRAHEYIEKLCGNIVRLPLLSPAQQRHLLAEWFSDTTAEKAQAEKVIAEIARLVEARPFLPANPRRIKGFANFIKRILLRNPGLSEAPEQDARALAIIASLYVFHPDLYAALERNPGDFWRELQRYCKEGFDSPRQERKKAELHSVSMLSSFRRPWSVVERGLLSDLVIGRSRKETDEEKSATPRGPAAEERNPSKVTLAFTPLFADATALNVLHCQALIAESNLTVDDFERFLRI